MTRRADVIVIGTGPGGGMAACRLAALGLDVVVLEKERLPRIKPCGGGIPIALHGILDWDVSAYVEAQPQTVRNLFDHGRASLQSYPHPILMVNRARFDQHFIERAIALGGGRVELREGFHVTSVEETEREVTVRGPDGHLLKASYLIAADGVSSLTARCLGLRPNAKAAGAIDAEVEVDPEIYERERAVATFNFSCLPNGYGWIFPKDGYLTCGVGSWGGRARLPRAMDDFLARSFPPGSIRNVKPMGHPIPLYAGPRRIATRRVCLVGDAASLVDPVMGEGIRFALLSGAAAAETVGALLGATSPSGHGERSAAQAVDGCEPYQQRIEREIGSEFEELRRFITPIFFRNPELFFRKFFQEGESYHALARQLGSRFPTPYRGLNPDSAAAPA